VSATIRPLTFVVALLASLLLALPAPAHAANDQLTGTALFNPVTSCPDSPSDYPDYGALDMNGSLVGCWYTNIETALITPGGVYHESGTELFVGQLDGGPAGTFTTTYKFDAKLNAAAAITQSSPAAGRAVSQAPPAESISRTSSETRSPTSTGATSAFADPALKHGQVDNPPGGRQPRRPGG
jgi:hypothetical protein